MTEPGESFRRPAAVTITAAAMGVLTATIGMITHPESAQAVDYPSWNDVQQAKANVQQQQAMVDRINGIVAQLQAQATDAGTKAEIATEAYNQAQLALQDATQKASDLQKQSDEAAEKAKTSSIRAGLMASHLMRSAGTDGSLNLLLQGDDSAAADKLLYQLGTMSRLTTQSQQIYDQAIADRNTAQAMAQQAKAAQDARQKASDDAQSALKAAQLASAAAQAAVATQQQKQGELTAQLASLQNTSVQVAQQYVVGQQVAAAAAAAAAAEKKRQEEAAAAAAAQQRAAAAAAAKGGSSSGGSHGSTPPTTTAPPSGSIVANVIAYARSQLGKPYAFGGAGPNSWDCSGLTMMAYRYAGINIGSHSVNDQYNKAAQRGQLVPRSQAQPGDLLFWGTLPGGLYHVGIYIGNGQMIAAPQAGENVKQQAVWGTPISVVARPSIGH